MSVLGHVRGYLLTLGMLNQGVMLTVAQPLKEVSMTSVKPKRKL